MTHHISDDLKKYLDELVRQEGGEGISSSTKQVTLEYLIGLANTGAAALAQIQLLHSASTPEQRAAVCQWLGSKADWHANSTNAVRSGKLFLGKNV